MEKFDIYKDIAERTQGDIYIGVVGPVRTGKSTFIKRFMDLLVLPNIENSYRKERAKDELPQSGGGRTIMTTEPKFVPNEAIELTLKDNAKFKVRMVDCVGYLVNGAMGHQENGKARMVTTPWFEKEIPFEEAAEIGTKKVITDHSTIGLVVTTDGSITDIERENYVEAEERVIRELKELKKPFVILLNSTRPNQEDTLLLRDQLEEKYSVPVLAADCARMSMEHINDILENVLFEFPIKEINITLPGWVEGLENSHWLKSKIVQSVKQWAKDVSKINDVREVASKFMEIDVISEALLSDIQLGNGIVHIRMKTNEGLFYNILEEVTGYKIEGDHQLLGLIREFSKAKREYDRVEQALKDVKETGYGLVPPRLEELELEEPEIFKQGNRFGVKLRANAPSLHLIRADIATEVSPVVGTEKQSEELLKYLLNEFEADPTKIWQTNMFGKSLHDMVKEQLQNKLFMMPEDARSKLQRTLQKVINEGSGGLICIIL
ncbi:stage IV sporulation protein A [Geosporobacter subterraneus DSM 17957]|uniref:Stage IV sporulation protein A n=1 Tax=Geosporobacter subterraneus DSM 17957 TaxID=1121919 RepID=A0A1M6GTY5_9FIRM|nr:stage IV sporulation protein A [Geosporobacter subterraneus]SHJ13387.1 stage IV sporulation protein A [Geosporobacter subterraneus DSM 17957]